MEDVEIHIVHSTKERDQTFDIRRSVFMEEFHVSLELEFDGLDDEAVHFILLYKKKPIGCARVRTTEKGVKLERIAILKEYRGKGFGTCIMNYLLDYCHDKNNRIVYLYSQIFAAGFYEKFHFQPQGEIFIEAGIQHIAMERIL